MKLTFLGTGTSFGVPVVGCDCRTCTSSDPRDRRTRHSALIETEEGRLLVDTPPELRLQLLASGIDKIDALWFTHMHADHVHGIDDVRVFTARHGDLPTYVPAEYEEHLTRYFRYIFDDAIQPPAGSSKPRMTPIAFEAGRPMQIVGRDFLPLWVPHGPGTTVYGFRVGSLGYITDAKSLPAETLEALQGVDTLVLNALWYGKPHGSHFNIEEAIEAAADVGARRTFLTHLTHRVLHEELEHDLPSGVLPAYDGLTLEID